jgi:endogenous inhibitor of DNA gyrase (YacG/DUF329 family)
MLGMVSYITYYVKRCKAIRLTFIRRVFKLEKRCFKTTEGDGHVMKRKETVRVIEQQVQSAAYTRRVTLEKKTCPVCGKTFEGVKIRQFCSSACQKKADYERHAEQYRKARMEKYHALRASRRQQSGETKQKNFS